MVAAKIRLALALLGLSSRASGLVVNVPDPAGREQELISTDSYVAAEEEAGLHMGVSALLGDLMSGCMADQEGPREDLWNLINNRSKGTLFLEDKVEQEHASRRPVLWVHLHNFAGTYMCQEAGKQHERRQPGSNCNLAPDSCSTLPDQRVHCHDRAQSGNSFSMVERAVDDADFCYELLSGVIFRDPLSGALSTLRANYFNKAELMQVLQSGTVSRIEHKPCLPDWDSFQHFDNFATRTLGGGYDAPPRGVTRTHLEKAKDRVASMDVVIILEQLQEQLVQLEATFGWNTRTMSPGSPANAHCGSAGRPDWTNSERTFLQQVNALDYELLDFAKAVAANRTHAAAVALRR